MTKQGIIIIQNKERSSLTSGFPDEMGCIMIYNPCQYSIDDLFDRNAHIYLHAYMHTDIDRYIQTCLVLSTWNCNLAVELIAASLPVFTHYSRASQVD